MKPTVPLVRCSLTGDKIKPSQLVADLRRCGAQSLSVTLHFIADRLRFCTMEDGGYPHEPIEYALVLRQMAFAAEEPPFVESVVVPEKVCHSCGHPHTSGEECGMDMGGAGKCKCDMEVSA